MKRLKCAYKIVVENCWCPFNGLALVEQIPGSSGRKSFQVWRLLLFDLPVPLCQLSPFQQLRNTAVSESNIIKRSFLGLQKVDFPKSVQQKLSTVLQKSSRWALKKQRWRLFRMNVRAECWFVCGLWPVKRRLSLFSGLNPSLLPHSFERPSFSAAPPSPSLSHS